VQLRTDCVRFTGSLPCAPHKRDGRTCERCDEYAAVEHRVLIVKLAAAGDVLRTTCVLPAIRRAWPGAQVTWVTERAAIPLLEDNPLVDRVVAREDAIERLLVERFDVAFGLDPDEQGGALTAMARCAHRYGYALDGHGRVMPLNAGAHAWWRMGLDDETKRANRRTFQSLLFETCELDGTPPRPQMVVTDTTRRRVRQRLGASIAAFARIVLLNTGGGGRWAQKKWTLEHYRGLARRLRSEQPETAVLIAGGPEESALNTALLASFGDPGIVDAGCDNSLKEFAAIVEMADLVVTSDSLALHMATALSRPVVALVGPTSPWELETYGSGEVLTADVPCLACYRRSCDKPVTCMERLTPDDVYAACLRVGAAGQVPRLPV